MHFFIIIIESTNESMLRSLDELSITPGHPSLVQQPLVISSGRHQLSLDINLTHTLFFIMANIA